MAQLLAAGTVIITGLNLASSAMFCHGTL